MPAKEKNAKETNSWVEASQNKKKKINVVPQVVDKKSKKDLSKTIQYEKNRTYADKNNSKPVVLD